jgi:hypothetical protein
LDLNPDIRIQKLAFGAEQAPLLVVDNFVADPEELVAGSRTKSFVTLAKYFPGVRTKAPLSYQQLFARRLKDLLLDYFQIEGRALSFSMCHYSLVTTPVEKLVDLQRVPHIDSPRRDGLASIHYLFKKSLGGTAFYRHRQTGFESIDESRQDDYFRCLYHELKGPDAPPPGYINGDTALFEEIAKQEGIFNRLLVYRRNSLHSGAIGADFVPDTNPLTGRLSINSFIDFGQ